MELTSEERAVYTVVKQYDKREPISRGDLVRKVARLGFDLAEQQVHETVKQLRRKEYLICSVPGNNDGYYTASSLADYEEFDAMEYGAKIADMAETRAAMKRAAVRQFGRAYQSNLFGGF